VKQLTYEEWLDANGLVEDIVTEKCGLCEGSGECRCPDCFAYHDCGDCKGVGTYETNVTREQYEVQKHRDEKAVARHEGTAKADAG